MAGRGFSACLCLKNVDAKFCTVSSVCGYVKKKKLIYCCQMDFLCVPFSEGGSGIIEKYTTHLSISVVIDGL